MSYRLPRRRTTALGQLFASACDLDAVAKPQTVRLIDVFVLGPACLAVACGVPMKSKLARAFWAIAGIGTIYYNARNYLRLQEAIRRDASGDAGRAAWRLVP